MIVPLFHVTTITRVCDRGRFWVKLHHPFHVLLFSINLPIQITLRLGEGKKYFMTCTIDVNALFVKTPVGY